MAAVLLICGSSVYLLIGISKQYTASVVYANTVGQFRNGADYNTTDAGLLRAQTLNPQDLYLAEQSSTSIN